MPIAFSCTECGRTIKAPDDLAGRKVKCPGCKAPQTVAAGSGEAALERQAVREEGARAKSAPGKDQAVQPPTLRRPPPRLDPDGDRPPPRRSRDEEVDDDRPPRRSRDEDKDDDRPRRSRDRGDNPARRGGNKGLIIGLSVGGGLLVIGGVVLIILLASGGSGDKKGGPGGPGPGGPGLPSVDRTLETDLKQIGLAYHAYHDVHRKGPSRAEDMFPFMEGGTAANALSSGRVVFIYNVRITEMVDGTVNTVVAYESAAPTRGGLVLFGDGSVRTLSAAEFAAAPKARPR